MNRLLLILAAFACISLAAGQEDVKTGPIFEVGFQFDQGGSTPFVFIAHDLFLVAFDSIGVAVYFSPSAELTFNRGWWAQAQLLFSHEIATLSLRALYHSELEWSAHAGLQFQFR